jgi:cephalosporin-C deacetylase
MMSQMECSGIGKNNQIMTGNIYRAYKDATRKSAIGIPAFSRLRENLIFQNGDKIEIFAFPDKRPVSATWELSKNAIEESFLKGHSDVCYDQSIKTLLSSEKLKPGFYDLHFNIKFTDDDFQEAITTFGYRIEEISITDSRPSDFDSFWENAKSELEKIPFNASEEYVGEFTDEEIEKHNTEYASLPENYNFLTKQMKKTKLHKIKFDSFPNNRMSTFLAIPNGEGPFPGLLLLPGAGCSKLPAPLEQARHGYVSLMLHIHGDMDIDQETYNTPPHYLNLLDDKGIEEQYYYNVYLACIQAFKYLSSRSEVISDKISVAGASQGGLLSIITAALCPNVNAVIYPLCYYAYWPYRNMVEKLNKQKTNGENVEPHYNADEKKQKYLSYYDPVNFAPLVKAPALTMVSLCDTPSPATTVYAVYKSLGKIKKEICWSPCTNHDMSFAFERYAWKWLNKFHIGA